jgi:hypothetical protein
MDEYRATLIAQDNAGKATEDVLVLSGEMREIVIGEESCLKFNPRS